MYKYIIMLILLNGCGVPLYNGQYPQGYGPKYSCIESDYEYRDVASKTSDVFTSQGNYKIEAFAGLVGYIVDYMNPRNHGCIDMNRVYNKPTTPSNQKNLY